MKLDRRNFLFLAGGAAGGVAAGRLSLKAIGVLNEALAPEMNSYPGEEKFVHTICNLCSGGCGLRVRTVGGKPVKIDGNPLYPVNRSGACPRAQALLQWVYHPDRILSPQLRAGDGKQWEGTSWEKAFGTLSAALNKLHSQKQENRLVVVSGRPAGLTRTLLARFQAVYGGNPLFCLPTGMETSQRALQLMAGSSKTSDESRMAYDLENSRCVLNFGCDLLEGWGTPAHTLRLFGHWRDANREKRTTLIHFDSRLSISAARADEWVPLRTGMVGAAALGLAFVLVSENLYNRDFVDNHTFGFEDWTDSEGRSHVGFRTLVREEYRLSRVSELTGIPPATLIRVAREFAAGAGSVAIGPRQSPTEPGALSDALAIHSLNALVGSVGARGGVALVPDAGWQLPGKTSDDKKASDFVSESLEQLQKSLAASPQVVILDQASRLLDLLNTADREKLKQVPLIATTASLQDATTAYANLVLPDCSPLETWADGQAPSTFPYQLLAVAEPVIAPRGESKPFAESLLRLAQAMGPASASEFPWKDLPELLQASSAHFAQYKRGYMFGTEVDEHWERLLERGGWWNSEWNSEQKFWDGLKENGGWWDPVYWSAEPQRTFPTASGKFEFYSHALDDLLRKKGSNIASGSDRDADRALLPHHVELLPPSDAKKFPLVLEPYDLLPFFGNGGREIAYLQQISSLYGGLEWQNWVELTPEDAKLRDLSSGDLVWVESAAGKIRRVALIVEGGMPGIVSAPRAGAPSTGRWSEGKEEPLADIIAPVLDPVLGSRCSAATRVSIYKA
jgi:anaerobic selenocysteine-containing dehydrogenase